MTDIHGQRKQKLINDHSASLDTTYSSEKIEEILGSVPEAIPSFGQNILHNWDFRNPVNQRGQTVYEIAAGSTYSLDRWLHGWNSTIEIMPGYIRFSGTGVNNPLFRQRLEGASLYAGLTLTASIIYRSQAPMQITLADSSHVVIPQSTGVAQPSNDWNMFSHTITISSDLSVFEFRVHVLARDISADIMAIKLELGTHSTLTNDPPMDFGRELSICQRYLCNYNPVRAGFSLVGIGAASSTTRCNIIVPTPVTMRANPAVIHSGGFMLWSGVSPSPVVNSITFGRLSAGAIEVATFAEGLVTHRPYYLLSNSAADVLLFSAEL